MTKQRTLEVKNLHVTINGEEILKGLNLRMKQGEVVAIMGPNGSGKSTLSYTIMGHPKYIVEKGNIFLDEKSIVKLKTDQRARKGLFLSFQYPSEISGVSVTNFLRTVVNSHRKTPLPILEFKKLLDENVKKLGINQDMLRRYLNEGFSGGEKKRAEMLQMNMLKPDFAILDETDSGLDIDALKVVAESINDLAKQGKGILLITHYQRLLDYVKPDKIHILMDGKIVLSGGKEIASQLEKKGYDWLKK